MSSLTRRSLIATSTAGAAGAVLPNYALSDARADAMATAEVGRHVPFYRSKLGSADLTIVSDGTIGFPPGALWPEVPEDELEAFLADFYQPTERTPLQLNAMVADLNGRRVLIDCGDGRKFQPTAGRLPENLEAAGIDPATIETVIVTHLHPDHLWGVTDADNEALAFPNAEYVVSAPELAFWHDPDLPGRMPDDLLRGIATTNLGHLARIEDRLRTIPASGEAIPGITFLPAPGHTPGHVCLMLESDGDALLSIADLVGDPLVGFERPRWGVGFDWDVEQGTASRLAVLDLAATDGLRVFGFHLPWPGFGMSHGKATLIAGSRRSGSGDPAIAVKRGP